ncbi:MAG TPA: ATP12 family protein [Rhodospirillales bacterium]|nr:ATP12 family protein [Rhodospirillales bacterium]
MLRGARRFYRTVAIAPGDGGFRVLLGGRPVRTPAGAMLAMPTAALAAAVANEWLAQGETLRPETMPLTRLTATALDRIGAHRRAVIDGLVGYAGSDLVCYRADGPPDLVALQSAVWQPLVDWAETVCGTAMTVSIGIVPATQPQPAVDGLRRLTEAASDRRLTALATVVQASGSLVIGLALVHGRIEADTAAEAALLDEHWQAARWGSDAEAEARRAEIASEIRTAALFLALAGDDAAAAA